MLHELLDPVSTKIKALPWVHKYGGVTKFHNHPQELDDKKKVISYPITCSLDSRDCWQDGKYMALVPSGNGQSIVYLESTGTSPILGNGAFFSIKNTYRVMIWLNLPALGVDGCSVRSGIISCMIKILGLKGDSKSHNLTLATYPDINRVKTQIEKFHTEEETIKYFSRYNYHNAENMYLYPNEVISLDFSLTVDSGAACLVDFVPKTPITCLDLS